MCACAGNDHAVERESAVRVGIAVDQVAECEPARRETLGGLAGVHHLLRWPSLGVLEP